MVVSVCSSWEEDSAMSCRAISSIRVPMPYSLFLHGSRFMPRQMREMRSESSSNGTAVTAAVSAHLVDAADREAGLGASRNEIWKIHCGSHSANQVHSLGRSPVRGRSTWIWKTSKNGVCHSNGPELMFLRRSHTCWTFRFSHPSRDSILNAVPALLAKAQLYETTSVP